MSDIFNPNLSLEGTFRLVYRRYLAHLLRTHSAGVKALQFNKRSGRLQNSIRVVERGDLADVTFLYYGNFGENGAIYREWRQRAELILRKEATRYAYGAIEQRVIGGIHVQLLQALRRITANVFYGR